ncbi:MAG: glycosyltransferase family 2 protein [Fibromonadaceae bacterium]|jgi:cellulose synthase/poly-beta-1,6-N-acetylglucosamine synthase-like glycosyltransferase|nr:glycosyltransferase family 2 protein [Fibromonadaceae bacterium]
MTFIFWLCFVLLVQVYILYPQTLRLLTLLKPTPPSAPLPRGKYVSIIIAAYNEQSVIEKKILNTLALDYPRDKIEILIGDDGSSDGTAEIVKRYSSQVRLLKNEKNEGKAAMLNKLCEAAKGEIFLFSDANTMLEGSALKNLIAEFTSEKIGCVCGQLVLKDESDFSLSKTESLYWKRESRLKALESGFGAVMGSNGALYAIRSELYTKLPTHKTIMDDFYISAKILMKNYACVFCEKALAFENTSASKFGEFKRKVRIGRANFNFLLDFLPMLNPLRPIRAYIFISHKLLRWLSPFLLLAIFSCSIFLMQTHIFYKIFFAVELLFVIAALLGVRVCNYFLSMNFALFLGFCKSFFKEKSGAWKRVERL